MYQITLAQLHQLLGSEAPSQSRRDICDVTIDSRTAESGMAFLALSGHRCHGAAYADSAIANGAECVITDRSVAGSDFNDQVIRVRNSLTALRTIAQWNRDQSDAQIWGITGSVGKTTTRQMLYAVLETQLTGIQSPANFNNEIGVPLSLIQLSESSQFGAVELAARHCGEIAELCRQALPHSGIITRIAPCHLESFQSLEEIRRTKQELAESLPAEGFLILNADDPAQAKMANVTSADVHWIGTTAPGPGQFRILSASPTGCRITAGSDVFCYKGGRHLASAAASAIMAGRLMGLPTPAIQRGLQNFQPGDGRGKVHVAGGVTIIDESYNASPASVVAAAESVADWKPRRLTLVLGDMLELGPQTEDLQRSCICRLLALKPSHIFFVGRSSQLCRQQAIELGCAAGQITACPTAAAAALRIAQYADNGDLIWIKGSRSLGLEDIVSHLCRRADDSREAA